MSAYRFIEAEKVAERKVASACALMEVSRSAFYGWHHHRPGPRAIADAKLEAKIVEIHAKSRATYGSPRIKAALAREGTGVGRKRVARLMALRGLAGRHRRRKIRTTIPDPEANTAMIDRLARAFDPESVALDRVYLGDITYIRTHEGWLYLATCLDLASRRVVGFSMADHMRASLVCDALAMAIKARRPEAGFTFHSDRGSQGEFQRWSQHLSSEELRWDTPMASERFGPCAADCVRPATRQAGVVSTCSGSGMRSHAGCRARTPRLQLVSRLRSGTVGSGKVAACEPSAAPSYQAASSPSPSEKRSPFSGLRAVAFGRSLARSAALPRPSPESCAAMRQAEAAGSITGPRTPSGMPTDAPSARRRPSLRPTTPSTVTCRTAWLA
jgi:hypothetical protein